MSDATLPPPKPRPRRRRTDIDPNAPSPPVANERRRRTPTADSKPGVAPLAAAAALDAAVDGPADAVAPVEEGTKVFHVPGMAAAATVAGVAGVASGGVEAAGGALGYDPEEQPVPTAAVAAGGAAALADRPTELAEEPLPVVTDVPPGAASQATPSWLAVLDDRSPDPDICPFLRATSLGGLTAPFEQPDAANRCAALAEAVPQSLRQQELVCLTTGHVNCPRYLRGAAVMTETPKAVVRERQQMSVPMLASLVVLVIAITASVGFVLARGGALSIGPGASPGGSQPLAVVSPSPASIGPSISPSLVAEATPTPDPTPSPTADADAQPEPDAQADATRDRRHHPTAISSSPRARTRRAVGSTRSGEGTTSSASPTTSAYRPTPSTAATRGCGTAACAPASS